MSSNSSSNDVWTLIESDLLRSLELGLYDQARINLDKLMAKFPKSIRVGRLTGMFNESKGEYERALFIYNEYLKENPASILLLKRKVAIHKSLGKFDDAVEELNVILKYFPFDVQSWVELASIYLAVGDLHSAAHCYEELILIDPHDFNYHIKLAEVYYSIGEFDYFMLARKHYTISLNIASPKVNLRSLYGIISAASQIDQDNTTASLKKKEVIGSNGVSENSINKELLNWAKETLFELSESLPDENTLKIISNIFN